MKAPHRNSVFDGLFSSLASGQAIVLLALSCAVAGCGKKEPAVPEDAGTKSAGKAGVSIDQAADAPPPAPAPDAPAPTAAPTDGTPSPAGASLDAEARKKRNLEWLRILKTGSEQQKAKVQEQFTHLPSEQLEEITELYQKQEKLK